MNTRTPCFRSDRNSNPTIVENSKFERVGVIYGRRSDTKAGVPDSVCWATINERDEIEHASLQIAEIPSEDGIECFSLAKGVLTPRAAVRSLNQSLAGARLESDFFRYSSGLRALYCYADAKPSWTKESIILGTIWSDLSIQITEDLSFKTSRPLCVDVDSEDSAISFVQHYRDARRARNVMLAALSNFQTIGRNADRAERAE